MKRPEIIINNQSYSLEELYNKVLNDDLPVWEKQIYSFVLNWYDSSDYIVQKTSGSTGEPKEIKLKKSAMKWSASNTCQFFGLEKNDAAWLCLPIEYIAGKMMVVRALTQALNLLITEPKGIPETPDQNIIFTAMVPLQVQKMITHKADFSNIKKLIIGGAAIEQSLLQSIQKIPTKVYATYGMTETCSHIALQKINGNAPDKAFQLLDGIDITQNDEGCLLIKASSLHEQTIQTSDIVEIIQNNQFKWLGRSDHIINSGGLKISPEQLEKEIQTIIGHECIISAVKDQLLGQKLVLVLEKSETKLNTDKLLIEIKERVGKHRTPKAVYYLEQFPRNKSMKIDRIAVRKIISKKQNI